MYNIDRIVIYRHIHNCFDTTYLGDCSIEYINIAIQYGVRFLVLF